MMTVLVKLGATILGVIIKIISKDNDVSNIIDGFSHASNIIEQDFFTQRNLDRKTQDISDNIAESCCRILGQSEISAERSAIICGILIEVINKADLSYKLIIEHNASIDIIYRRLSEISRTYEKEFDPDEYDVFLTLLRHIASIIVNSALESPCIVNYGVVHITATLEELQKKVDHILNQLDHIDNIVSTKASGFQNFERHYRNNIAWKYGWIQLLGANSLDREEKRYKLSIAYVALELREGKNTGGNLNIEKLFCKSNWLWVDGEAGSGKSTLMQWIAVSSAANNSDVMPELKDTIPFLIELRKHNTTNISIKAAVDSVMASSDITMPDNWITRNLKSGNAIVLIDGFDEIKPESRDNVLNWIDDLITNYPKVRIIVTSRPQVVKKIGKKFVHYRLLPMTREKVNLFLEYWHEAVLVDKLGINKDEANRYMKKLFTQIDSSESIRRMVTNPLLCAMICALHFKNGSIMSTERNELYDDCCKMLFGNRDIEKDVQVFSHIKLSYEEKKNILSQLAYWMMINNLVIAKTEQVIACIKRALAGLRPSSQQYPPMDLFQYFLERSGILRSPEEGYVDFIHKSFQEYLAANEIHNKDNWGFIASKYSDINWYETLLLSMGFANDNNSKYVIEKILEAGTDEKNIVIAAACGANAPRLVPELRKELAAKIENVLPPKDIDMSERLADAGDFVVSYLQFENSLSTEERFYSLNTLRKISSIKALTVAGSYLNSTSSTSEIEIIGNMLEGYTDKEIQAVDFKKTICDYLDSISDRSSLTIPEIFLSILQARSSTTIKKKLSNFSSIVLTNYQNHISDKEMLLFSSVASLTLIGHFDSISAIKRIARQLFSLELCDSSASFDFYELNDYSFDSLQRIHFFSNRVTYINGNDCNAIKNVNDLGLYLYDPDSEVLFINFDNFSRLKSLSLFHEYIVDFCFCDLNYLVHNEKLPLEKLIVKLPLQYDMYLFDVIKKECDKISEVNVQYDDNPYALDVRW